MSNRENLERSKELVENLMDAISHNLSWAIVPKRMLEQIAKTPQELEDFLKLREDIIEVSNDLSGDLIGAFNAFKAAIEGTEIEVLDAKRFMNVTKMQHAAKAEKFFSLCNQVKDLVHKTKDELEKEFQL